MWIIGQVLLNHRTHHGDLLIGHWHCLAANTHNACYTNSFQHCDPVSQRKIAKEVTAEQRDLDNLYTVLPGAALTPQRQQLFDALCSKLVTDHLLMPRPRLNGIPVRVLWFLYEHGCTLSPIYWTCCN